MRLILIILFILLSIDNYCQVLDSFNKDTVTNTNELKEKIIGNNVNKYQLIDQLVEIEGEKSSVFFQSLFLIDPLNKNGNNKQLQETAMYGIRKLLEFQAKKISKEFKFCPICQEKLSEYQISDCYLIGLQCAKYHKFHIEVKHGQFTNPALMANGENWKEIAKIWLTDEKYRSQIATHQIAEIIRKFVELDNKIEETDRNSEYKYCPVCSNILSVVEQDDVWIEGLICTNKHSFSSRNGITYNNVELKPDISKADFNFLLNAYLSDEQSSLLPNQLKELLHYINANK